MTWRWFYFVLSRAIVLYFAVFLLSTTFIKYQKLKMDAELRLLNQLMPTNFVYLVETIEKKGSTGKKEIIIYRNFFDEMVKHFPETPDAYTLLGFCYYYENKKDLAIATLKIAVKKSPEYFWNYYNLGVIYFKDDNYREAVKYLDKAIASDRAKALQFILNSTAVYRLVRSDNRISDDELGWRFALGLQSAYRLIILSHERLRNYADMSAYAQSALVAGVGAEETFYYYAGLAEYHMKNYDRALAYFQECLRRDADHPESYYYVGLILKAKGDRENAARVLNRSEFLKQARQAQPTKTVFGFPIPDLGGEGVRPRIF